MANLAQLNLTPHGRESQIRALLEDVADYHMGIYPHNRLALAVWFRKSPQEQDQYLLELFAGVGGGPYLGLEEGIAQTRFSLRWREAPNLPPFVNLRATSVDFFTRLLQVDPQVLEPFFDKFELLYFDKDLLTPQIVAKYHLVTEPPALIKGWYIPQTEYEKLKTTQAMLSAWGGTRPQVGLVKTWESSDFETCRGLLHVEVQQKWLPVSPEGIRPYNYWRDLQAGQRVFLLLEGGALYEVLQFEIKAVPDYFANFKLLERTPQDRYPEVYLRAVRPSAKPAA